MPASPAADKLEPSIPVTDALDLLAYLVTAADLCTREPLHYGMIRLVDAAGRLASGLAAGGAAVERPWLVTLHERIERDKETLMWDRPAFEQFLHQIAGEVAGELRAEQS
jgi:hypothetical protein